VKHTETWWWPSARAETCCLSNKYSNTLLVVYWLYYLHHLFISKITGMSQLKMEHSICCLLLQGRVLVWVRAPVSFISHLLQSISTWLLLTSVWSHNHTLNAPTQYIIQRMLVLDIVLSPHLLLFIHFQLSYPSADCISSREHWKIWIFLRRMAIRILQCDSSVAWSPRLWIYCNMPPYMSPEVIGSGYTVICFVICRLKHTALRIYNNTKCYMSRKSTALRIL